MPNPSFGGNNLESNYRGATATCYAMAHLEKPDLYTLIELNAFARSVRVLTRNEADIIFSNDKTPPVETTYTVKNGETIFQGSRIKEEVPIITAYDLDYFMGQML
jgi:hypothetical protein